MLSTGTNGAKIETLNAEQIFMMYSNIPNPQSQGSQLPPGGQPQGSQLPPGGQPQCNFLPGQTVGQYYLPGEQPQGLYIPQSYQTQGWYIPHIYQPQGKCIPQVQPQTQYIPQGPYQPQIQYMPQGYQPQRQYPTQGFQLPFGQRLLQGVGNLLVNYQPYIQLDYGPSYAEPSTGQYPRMNMVWNPSQFQ